MALVTALARGHPTATIHAMVQVLRNSGVEAVLKPGSGGGGSAIEVGAVHDALEALVAIVSGSEEGQLVALQSGAIAAAVTTLQVSDSLKPVPDSGES